MPRAFEAHDADVALAQFVDQRAQFRLLDIEAGYVEHHGPPEEEPGGTGGEIVEPGKPVLERQFRGKRQGKEGTPLEADGPGFG